MEDRFSANFAFSPPQLWKEFVVIMRKARVTQFQYKNFAELENRMGDLTKRMIAKK